MDQKPTVFVVDDDEAVLQSLAYLLESEGLETKCFSSSKAFLETVKVSDLGCLILDMKMPGGSGLDLLKEMADGRTSRPTIVITAYAEVEIVVQSMKLGAVDFLQKPFHPGKLLVAIQKAMEIELRERTQWTLKHEYRKKLDALTSDEKLVLKGIARGMSNQEIADEMDVSLRTVQFRRASLVKKLGIREKAELVKLLQFADGSY